jgi:hypothetical protein
MILERFTTRKTKHVNNVGDHIWSLHNKLMKEVLELRGLKGKELTNKAKEMQCKVARIHKYKKYLGLVTM